MPVESKSLTLGRLTAAICVALLLAGGAFYFTTKRPGPAGGGSKKPASAEHEHSKEPATAESMGVRKPSPPRNDYVGSAACAECHAGIAESYKTHSMSRSMARVDVEDGVEDFGETSNFSPDDRHHYRVERNASGVVHHESLTDAEGEVLYDQGAPVAYAVGSGAHGRSYLLDRGGLMFMSPISWYSGSRKWGLSPGYKLPTHRRFDRRATDACLDCHAGRLNKEGQPENRLGDPPFLELSIGCERCHGPGGEHARMRRDTLADASRDPIVNPAKLSPPHREDICANCHLQGRGRVSNYGCQVVDFRPGQRLEETHVTFVDGTRVGKQGSRAVSQVEQMRSSACFRESEGRMGCTNCHDPHSLPKEAERVAFYRAKCLTCHSDRGCALPEPERLTRQADDSCFACHMPRLNTSDVPHTAQTDHRVPRRPLRPGEGESGPAEFPEMFDSAEKRLPELAVVRARGLWLAERADQRTDRARAAHALELLTAVEQLLPDDPAVVEALGNMEAIGGKFDEALAHWKQVLKIEPERESTLRTLALLFQNTQKDEQALPYMETYLRVQPWNASMWGRYSQLLARADRWKDALEAARKALELDPSIPRAYQWLADLYRENGDLEQSRHYAEVFQKMEKEASRKPAAE